MRPKTLPIADDLTQCLPVAKRMAAAVANQRKSSWALEDMTAWALEAAWKAVRTFDASVGLTLKQYVQLLARRACYDCLRTLHNGTRHKWVETCEVPRDLVDESRAPDDNVIAFEHLAHLRALVEDLPPRERRVIVRHYFHDVRMEEIATEFGISRPRASMLKEQAFERLHRQMILDGKTDP